VRIKDLSTDNEIPRVGKLMTDMLVMALACDMTAVGTLQWSDTEALYTLPWLGLSEHHHYCMMVALLRLSVSRSQLGTPHNTAT
jgi:hypothetical protein